jgi:hypothetical protein
LVRVRVGIVEGVAEGREEEVAFAGDEGEVGRDGGGMWRRISRDAEGRWCVRGERVEAACETLAPRCGRLLRGTLEGEGSVGWEEGFEGRCVEGVGRGGGVG